MIRSKAIIFLAISSLFVSAAYAVEVAPNIGFRQYASPNGSQYDPNGNYRVRTEHDKLAMNNQIPMGKLVPDFNSVGLDFTFKVD